eukprot:TRINITY_DN10235_c0_g5_i1.p1 TRINITY_DN10235_c0_g5~~TRINITY_DN10235_c0_g5_i1.p1  ORF type:complete len:152 (-),score=7.49 TRINITY_DN10235_c0_g5_i1:266-721(-)
MLQLISSYTSSQILKQSLNKSPPNSRLYLNYADLTGYFLVPALTTSNAFEKSPKGSDMDSYSLTSPSLANEPRCRSLKQFERRTKSQCDVTLLASGASTPRYGVLEVAVQTENVPLKIAGKSKGCVTTCREEIWSDGSGKEEKENEDCQWD